MAVCGARRALRGRRVAVAHRVDPVTRLTDTVALGSMSIV
jgi:hypothetical protein